MTASLPIPLTPPLTDAQQTAVINLIRRAAKTEILPRFYSALAGIPETKSGPHDLVTEADTEAEAMLTRGIQRLFPHALVIGEEQSARNPDLVVDIDAAEMAFVIDPIDGTWNFAHRLGMFGTILSVTRFGKPALGILYDPLSDDWVIADSITPASRVTAGGSGRSAHTAATRPLSEMTGSVHIYNLPEDRRAGVFGALAGIGRLQVLRCACHEYRMLAQGQIDFVLSGTPWAWDHAAGVLICEQAGGVSKMLDGRPYTAGTRDGFVLSAATEQGWDALRDHFAFLLG